MLRPGRAGLGFAVGAEALPSIFANYGVKITASDLNIEASDPIWSETGQHAASLEALYHPEKVGADDFNQLVSFQTADMNDIEDFGSEEYDFLWSSCSLEHLGTLELGTEFVKKAMRLLKPGGVAVHTTEYNCASNTSTAFEGTNVIYRRCDLERLASDLAGLGHSVGRFDFDIGSHPFDWDYDTEPFLTGNGTHIKLLIEGHVSTSCLIIVEKGQGYISACEE
jgi:SAM-dependent methyltransferase